MKNLSCFKCYYHRCIDKNICLKSKCKLPEGKYYKSKDRIVEEIKGGNNDRVI